MSEILVTGAAGFIGYHVCERLLARGETVLGLDNLSPYYDVRLKEARVERLRKRPGFRFEVLDIEDRDRLRALLARHAPDRMVHLAARVGVRDSLQEPHAYVQTNVAGFLNVAEASRERGVRHLVFASSSSVYGESELAPFSTHAAAVHPVSIYAATKRAGELLAHALASLHRLPMTGLRFFTVYGPWGRPDMAVFHFTRAILRGDPIEVYHDGKMLRDFTYVDDVADAVVRALDRPPVVDPGWTRERPDPAASSAPFRVYNVGQDRPIGLLDLIALLEQALGRKAVMRFRPRPPGDVLETHADITETRQELGYAPRVTLEAGIPRFVEWYRSYYGTAQPEPIDAGAASYGAAGPSAAPPVS